jgi:hypothetical protein
MASWGKSQYLLVIRASVDKHMHKKTIVKLFNEL